MSRSLRKSMTTTIPIHPKKTDMNFPLIWTSPRIGTSSSKMSKLLRSKATVRVGGRRQILSDEDDFVGSAARNVNLTLTGRIANKYLDSRYKQSVLASDWKTLLQRDPSQFLFVPEILEYQTDSLLPNDQRNPHNGQDFQYRAWQQSDRYFWCEQGASELLFWRQDDLSCVFFRI